MLLRGRYESSNLETQQSAKSCELSCVTQQKYIKHSQRKTTSRGWMCVWLNVGAIQNCFMSRQQQVKYIFILYQNLFCLLILFFKRYYSHKMPILFSVAALIQCQSNNYTGTFPVIQNAWARKSGENVELMAEFETGNRVRGKETCLLHRADCSWNPVNT